jgi:hypothetical protein
MAARKPASTSATGIHVSQARLALLEALSHLKQAAARAPTHKARLQSKATQARKLFDSLEPYIERAAVSRARGKRKPAKKAPAKRKTPAKRPAPAKRKPSLRTPNERDRAANRARLKRMATKKTKASKPTAPAALVSSATKASVEDQIIAVAQRLGANRSNDVKIADVRAALPHVARKDFDVALRWLHGEANVALYRSDVPIDITEADKAGAFIVGDEPRHLMYVLNPKVTSVHPSAANIAPEPSRAEPKARGINFADDKEFAAGVIRVSAAPGTKRFGHHKAFISSVYEVMRDGGKLPFAMSLNAFKERLVAMHRAGLLQLARADLVSAMDRADVEASETHHLNAEYHFVNFNAALPREAVVSSMVAPPSSDSLHARIAKALGWTVKEAQSFSLPALRDLVQPVSPKLAEEITLRIQH